MNVLIIYPHGNALNPLAGAESRIWMINHALTKTDLNVSILHSYRAINNEDPELKKKCNVFYYKDLSIFGISDFYLSDLNPYFIMNLHRIIKNMKIDIIQIEFPWGFLITKFLKKKNTLLVYDSHGIESEFLKIATNNPNFPKILKPFAKLFGYLYEKLVCKFSDAIISLSEIDRSFYISNHGIDRSKTFLIQTPSTLFLQDFSRTDNQKNVSREKLGLPINKTIIIFHGGLPHPPNREAFDIIENYISPKIKDSNIIFALAGHNLEKYQKGNIYSLGFVDNLQDFLLSADFAIVPIISGTGMKTKCFDYIITGLPFIITKKGIEGIDFLEAGEDYLVYDSVDDNFIKGILRLYEDNNLYNKLHRNLLKKSKTFNRKKFENRFSKLYLRLLSKKL